jgi:hypothetical protein
MPFWRTLHAWGQGHPAQAALAETALLFAPALPAYLWLWPNVSGVSQHVIQLLAYGYLLAGALLIGRRRWTWDQLGVNGRGLGLSLVAGALLLAGRTLVVLAVDWPLFQSRLAPLDLLGLAAFYLGAVGVTEEVLFRGLMYRALEDWRGVRAAIWGSTLAFGLYHVPWQGWLGFLGTGLIGLVFAVIRWRAGGIAGLVIIHGLIDLGAVVMLPSLDLAELGQPVITSRALLLAGYFLLLAPPLALWKFWPALSRRGRPAPGSPGTSGTGGAA